MKINFDEEMKKDEEKYNIGSGGGSDFFNISEGADNVIRILQKGEAYATHFDESTKKGRTAYGFLDGDPLRVVYDSNGKKKTLYGFDPNSEESMKASYPDTFSIRYAQYVWDRSDNKVKLANLPFTVQNGVRQLQKNPDYAFEEIPMPYDIRITYDKEASPANKYKVSPTPNTDPVPQEILDELEKQVKQMSPEQFVEKMRDNQKEKDKKEGIFVTEEKLNAEIKAKNPEEPRSNKEEVETIEYPTGDDTSDDIKGEFDDVAF